MDGLEGMADIRFVVSIAGHILQWCGACCTRLNRVRAGLEYKNMTPGMKISDN
jgi:hypothetical protein